MTAAADAVTGKLRVVSIMFNATGGAAGEAITVTETSGAVIFNGYTVGTNDNMELMPAEAMWLDGIIWSAKPATGTSRLTIRVE
jgi:hypothetical protein